MGEVLFVSTVDQIILHVRRLDSPWGRYTVQFRDWLRAHPQQRQLYQDAKSALSAANAGKRDYDDYTRAKTAYFDRVQAEFERWSSSDA